MSKILLVIDMPDKEWKEFNNLKSQEMIVDIGFDSGWTYIRKKLLAVKPMPESLNWKYINETVTDNCEYYRCVGRQELIDELIGDTE